MRVKDLKELIKDLPDNTPVMEAGGDHDLTHTHAQVGTGLYCKETGEWVEDHGEGSTPESMYGKRCTVVIFGGG